MSSLLDTAVEVTIPLLLAALLGGIVGWERESWSKPAGLRTHMMVALGAAAFTRLALMAVAEGEAAGVSGGDPSRIVAGVATGLGFLGAGSIIHSRGEIRGLTTAAGIWVVGGIGACCGAEQYSTAVISVLLAVVILAVLPKVEGNVRSSQGGSGQDAEPEDRSG
jgi:putative Mg2+ transporter-C (MgtC) family protein